MSKLLRSLFNKFKKFGIYKEVQTYPEEELTSYINKIFEQQEKERIVRWLVNSIRESLDLDRVLNTTVEETGKLLKTDRCIIALFEKESENFYYRSEYKKNKNITSVINKEKTRCTLPPEWYDLLVKEFSPVIVNKRTSYNNGVKSLVIKPLVYKEEMLGIIMAHQTERERHWQETEIEILKDIGSQIAIAIKQAMLYAELQESTRLKSEFLSGMSHELRTPLNAIIGFSEMLLSEDYGELSEKQKKFINNISVSGEHLLRLVNDVLDLSKIESGNMEINYELFNVYQAICENVSVLNSLAQKKDINIEVDVEKGMFIKADLRRFKQVMYNLLSNAIKFTEQGQVTVIAFEDENDLKVEVHDTGIGISPKDRDKIFRHFRQLDSSITRKHEGTGLGLVLTKKLVELHKGTVDFESEEGKGSKFWFTIPLHSHPYCEQSP